MSLADAFPALAHTGFRETSPATDGYNCIAWAAGVSDRWWEPCAGYHWPDGVPRNYSVETLEAAYKAMGYKVCKDGALEEGFEKVAIFAIDKDFYEHAARQLPDGKWTSKLGKNKDIEHDLASALEGADYGKIVRYMKRPRNEQGKPAEHAPNIAPPAEAGGSPAQGDADAPAERRAESGTAQAPEAKGGLTA